MGVFTPLRWFLVNLFNNYRRNAMPARSTKKELFSYVAE